ncbi:MAG: transposase [Rhodospirillaceae bacterium]|nr:MAG: transposase [Rhodospirillaceae bacterium]
MKRSHLPGQPVHVLQRGNNSSPVFFGPQDARLYLEWLTQTALAEGVAIHAYVLMTNHIHLLATATTPAALGRCMQSVGIRYTRHINGTKGRTGTLWDGPYRAANISDGRYVLNCSRYIELNPVRNGLAASASAYRWSSYRANADGQADALITPHPIYIALGATPEARASAYRALFDEAIPDATLTAIRSATNGGAELSADYAPRPRGRPRRAA